MQTRAIRFPGFGTLFVHICSEYLNGKLEKPNTNTHIHTNEYYCAMRIIADDLDNAMTFGLTRRRSFISQMYVLLGYMDEDFALVNCIIRGRMI